MIGCGLDLVRNALDEFRVFVLLLHKEATCGNEREEKGGLKRINIREQVSNCGRNKGPEEGSQREGREIRGE